MRAPPLGRPHHAQCVHRIRCAARHLAWRDRLARRHATARVDGCADRARTSGRVPAGLRVCHPYLHLSQRRYSSRTLNRPGHFYPTPQNVLPISPEMAPSRTIFKPSSKWKGELSTQEHTPARPQRVTAGKVGTVGFSGTYNVDSAVMNIT